MAASRPRTTRFSHSSSTSMRNVPCAMVSKAAALISVPGGMPKGVNRRSSICELAVTPTKTTLPANWAAMLARVQQDGDGDVAHVQPGAREAAAQLRIDQGFARRVHAAAEQKGFERQRPAAHAGVVLVDEDGARNAAPIHLGGDVSQ